MKRSLVLVLSLLVLLTLSTVLYAEDTTPPDTTITSGPSGKIESKDVTFEWIGSDNETSSSDLTYSYKLEGKEDSWSNWTYNTSTSYSGLSAGNYRFKVKARDEAGNSDPTPASRQFTAGNAGPGTIKWEFATGDKEKVTSPAIGPNSTIYVGITNSQPYDENVGFLYAIEPDGNLKWSYRMSPSGYESAPHSVATVSPSGTIYLGSDNNKLYAVNSNSSIKWTFNTDGDARSSPALSSDGTIYMGARDNKLYALNQNGEEKWIFKTGSVVTSSPAIASNGIVYVGSSQDGKFYAINYNGKKKWEFKFSESADGWTPSSPSPAIAGDGTIYVTSPGGNLFALRPDGSTKWTFYGDGKMLHSSPVVGPERKIYIGADNGDLYAIDSGGDKVWAFKAGAQVSTTPMISSGGNIYFGTANGNVYGLNPNGTERWHTLLSEGVKINGLNITPYGTIYAGGNNFVLYALNSVGDGLADSSWPTFGHDVRHTGRVPEKYSPPEAGFEFSPDSPFVGKEITFDAGASTDADGNIAEYKWDWNDDGNYEKAVTSPTVKHTFSTADDYPVTLEVRDGEGYSDSITKTVSVTVPDDTTPPSPDPLTWNVEPKAVATTSIEMKATAATDTEGNGVQYYFKETTRGDDSGWQDSNVYKDTGLEQDTRYCYRTKARDKSENQNETGWSEEVCLNSGLNTDLPAGWSIISPPGTPNNPDPANSLEDDVEPLSLYYNYTSGEGYQVYPAETETTTLKWREGYWIYLSRRSQLDMTATLPDQEQTLEFMDTGWHMIGVPYSVDWSQVSFSDPDDFENDVDKVRMVAWSPEEELYYNHYSDNSYVLDPWSGYWIYVTSASSSDPATITVSYTLKPPSAPDTTTPLPQSVDRDKLDSPPKPPGYNETDISLQVLASPNPVSNGQEVVFKLKGSTEGVEKIKTTVFSADGSSVWEGQAQGPKLIWNTERVANGVYLYKSEVNVDGQWSNLGVAKLLVIK